MGIELDEPPILGPEDNTIIKENMTFSIEINTIIRPHTQFYLLSIGYPGVLGSGQSQGSNERIQTKVMRH